MTDEFEKLNTEFDEIKAAAHALAPLPEALEQSFACIAAYHTLRGIYLEQHLRQTGKEELTARGRSARKLFIDLRREEKLLRQAWKEQHGRNMRAVQLPAKLIKWNKNDGDDAALIDTLQAYIHALTGEDMPVTAKAICDTFRCVFLTDEGSADAPQQQNDKKKSPSKKQRFRPPTLDEVKAYFTEKRFKSDPEEFFDFYEGSAWKRGRGVQIKDWKATANNWERKEGEFRRQQEKNGGRKGSIYSSDASYDLEAYKKTAIGLYDDRPKEETA